MNEEDQLYIATLKQQIIELEDANRYLAEVIDKLMAGHRSDEDNGPASDCLEHCKNPSIGTKTLEGSSIRWPFGHKKVVRQSRMGGALKMSEDEKIKYLTDLNNKATLMMIEKGQKMKEAEGVEIPVKITKDNFYRLSPRIQNVILAAVWKVRDGVNENLKKIYDEKIVG